MARKERTGPSGEIHRRARLMHILFLLAAMLVVAKIVLIQTGPDSDELREQAEKSAFSRQPMPALRGNILDRNGRLLATTIPQYDIWMDFKGSLADSVFDNNVDALARELADFFGDKSQADYLHFLKRTRERAKDRTESSWTVRLPVRRINYEEERVVSRFPIFNKGQYQGGYLPLRVDRRVYPHGMAAKRAIGSIDTNTNAAVAGVELSYDRYLRGVDGQNLMQRVAEGFNIPVSDAANVEPLDGFDVVMTIDMELQEIAQAALARQLDNQNADWGTVVLMDVESGEIHAMSNLTRESPGVFSDSRNYAVGFPMEPGSTFKLATLLAMIEDGGIGLSHTEDCLGRGPYSIYGQKIYNDSHNGVLTMKQMFEKSSNIGFVKLTDLVYRNNQNGFFDYLKGLGLSERTGVDIPGEPAMRFSYPLSGDKSKFIMVAHGYGIAITPLRTLTLYNAVANGGVMVRPRVVKGLKRFDDMVWEYGTEVLDSAICSPRTIALARECLEGVALDGTARRFRGPYYSFGAKTGTAQISVPGLGFARDRWGGRNYLATIVGYFPAEKPKYSCIVAIKTYHGSLNPKEFHGGGLAGPVFKEVADKVVASVSKWDERQLSSEPLRYTASAYDFRSGRADLLEDAADILGAGNAVTPGIGDWIYVRDAEEDGKRIGRNMVWQSLALVQEPDSLGRVAVPDVTGMGLKDAMWLLESCGFAVAFEGRGAVARQVPAAGDYSEPVTRVRLELKY